MEVKDTWMLMCAAVCLSNVNVTNESREYEAKFKSTNWMSRIDDDKYLYDISVPGTHDSGALYESVPGTVKCQDLELNEQLDIGVRYLDVRCRSLNDIFIIHRGSIYQHLTFGNVIRLCSDFLKENPSETIIMNLKQEYLSYGSKKSFEKLFDLYVERNRYLWYLKSSIPRLGEVRGKIVLLRRFKIDSNQELGIDVSAWQNNSTFSINSLSNLRIQDCYAVKDNFDKWLSIINLYDTAREIGEDYLYINHTSGYKMSLGAPNIRSVCRYINPKILNYFRNRKGNFGISAVDFMDKDISEAIIASNF